MAKPILIILTLAGFASGAELEIPARLSVDGASVFRSSVEVVSASTQTPYCLAVGTSTNYSFTVSTGGRLRANEIYRGTYTVLDSSILDASGTMKVTGIQNGGATAGISVSAVTADRVIDYMEYASDTIAQSAYVTNALSGYGNTGGTITTDGDYTVHTFLLADTGTKFIPCKSGNVASLIVAGGGGGGGDIGGGGGAGGLIYSASVAVTAQEYTITVGAGGAGGNTGEGGSGGDSTFISTAIGGGSGGRSSGGGNGGSGGGESYALMGIGHGTSGQGHDGGYGYQSGGNYGGGGGGGANETGTNSSSSNGGKGGNGIAYSISGSLVTYAGGGGGAGYTGTVGAGGAGGGGTGGTGTGYGSVGSNATGYGSGGGGGGNMVQGGNGSAGIVIIRCKTSDFTVTPSLQSYSESAIKTQGSYSLKGIATTESLIKTLTRTVSPKINLSGRTQINFDIRSSTTGSNIKIGLHDSGGTYTEKTPTIISSDTWQTVNWDISAVTDNNKDAIDSVIITIASAPVANTFYIDNIYAPGNGNNDITFTSGSEKMRIDNSGNVGIGTTTPQKKLEVSGDIYVDQMSGKMIMKSPDGTCYSCGPANGGGWSCSAITCP